MLIMALHLSLRILAKGLICLSTSGYYTQLEILTEEQLRKIHQL